jgi:hypothetical protein
VTDDVSGSTGGGGDAGLGAIITSYISSAAAKYGLGTRGTGAMAARGAAGLARQMAVQAAKLAAKQWQFQQSQAFPESPIYGPQAVVTQVDVKPRYATKRTNILQKMMTHPDSKKLQAKLTKIDARIARSTARHPEFATQYAVQRKY